MTYPILFVTGSSTIKSKKCPLTTYHIGIPLHREAIVIFSILDTLLKTPYRYHHSFQRYLHKTYCTEFPFDCRGCYDYFSWHAFVTRDEQEKKPNIFTDLYSIFIIQYTENNAIEIREYFSGKGPFCLPTVIWKSVADYCGSVKKCDRKKMWPQRG